MAGEVLIAPRKVPGRARRQYAVLTCCLSTAYVLGVVGARPSVAAAAPPTVEQVQQALDIAEMSAENGLMELSQEAVRRALRAGPPTVSTATPPPSIQQFGARIDTTRPAPIPPVRIVGDRIPQTIRKLVPRWLQHASSEAVYETLRSVVLPDGRPNVVFLHELPPQSDGTSGTRLETTYCVALDLIRAAKSVGKLSDLVQEIQTRGLDHSVEATIVLLHCAMERQDAAKVTGLSSRLGRMIAGGTNWTNIRLAADVGMRLQLQGDADLEAANVLYPSAKVGFAISAADSSVKTGGGMIVSAAVRSCFAAGKEELALELLRLSVEQVRNFTSKRSSREGQLSRIRSLVAQELYGRGKVNAARDILGTQIAAAFESRYRNASLLPADPDRSAEITSGQPVVDARVLSVNRSTADEKQIWICSLNTETHQSEVLFLLPDFQNVSFPVLSPDGRMLAFAATFPGEVVTSDSRIYIASLDGLSLTSPGRGTMPSWSASGRRLVCSRYSPNRGVWLNRVGTDNFQVLDERGWAGRWSPDGLKISYIRSMSGRTEFLIADLAEDDVYRIAEGRRTSTAQSTWNTVWAPDSSCIIVEALGNLHGSQIGLARLSVARTSKNSTLMHNADYFNGDLLSHPRGPTVIVAPKLRKHGAERLYRLRFDDPEQLEYLEGQFKDRRNSGVSWMPDGKTLLYLSREMKR